MLFTQFNYVVSACTSPELRRLDVTFKCHVTESLGTRSIDNKQVTISRQVNVDRFVAPGAIK